MPRYTVVGNAYLCFCVEAETPGEAKEIFRQQIGDRLEVQLEHPLTIRVQQSNSLLILEEGQSIPDCP